MGAKLTTKLVIASVVAGGIVTPPVLRATKRQAEKALHRGAEGYISARDRVTSLAEATGKPGQIAAGAVTLTAQAAKEANDRWWALVAKVEREQVQPKIETESAANAPATIEDYIGSPS